MCIMYIGKLYEVIMIKILSVLMNEPLCQRVHEFI